MINAIIFIKRWGISVEETINTTQGARIGFKRKQDDIYLTYSFWVLIGSYYMEICIPSLSIPSPQLPPAHLLGPCGPTWFFFAHSSLGLFHGSFWHFNQVCAQILPLLFSRLHYLKYPHTSSCSLFLPELVFKAHTYLTFYNIIHLFTFIWLV